MVCEKDFFGFAEEPVWHCEMGFSTMRNDT